MKCSKCGYHAKDIAAMAKHYRKSHPGAMKAAKPRSVRSVVDKTAVMDDVYRVSADMIRVHEARYHKGG